MSKGERFLSIFIGILGLVLMGVQAWDVLDKRKMVSAAIAISVWVISALLVAYSIYRNFKDAHRAESLRAEIVTIKDENEVQLAAEYARGCKDGPKSLKEQQKTAPWLDALVDADSRDMEKRLTFVIERMRAAPNLEAVEPYVDLTFFLMNSSVFTLTLERVEGKVTHGPHGGPPLQSQPSLPEHGFEMPHGFQGELSLRQWISRETANQIKKSGSVILGTGTFALRFGYIDHFGSKQNVRKAFPDQMFTVSSKASLHEVPVLDSELPSFQNTRKHFMELSFSQRWALKKVLQSPGQRYPDLLTSLTEMGFAHADTDVGQLFYRELAQQQTNWSVVPSVWVVKFHTRLFSEFPLDPDTGGKHRTESVLSDHPKSAKLIIQQALYGPENRLGFEDVTHIVRAHLQGNTIDMEVSDKTFPEFPPGSRLIGRAFPSKYLLEVVYTLGDVKDQVIVRYSGSRLVLPEGSVTPRASEEGAL